MKRNILKKALILTVFAFVLCSVVKVDSSAASKAKVSYQKVNKSKTYKGKKMTMKANVYYKKAVLKGSSKAVKKINKAITADCNKFLKNRNQLYSVAKETADWRTKAENYNVDTYDYYAKSKVTYNKNGIISIKVSTYWFAGGVVNTDVYGLTYSLKTGKRLYLTNVCKGSASAIKKMVLNKIRKDPESSSMDWSLLNKYKIKKMNFYLKPGKKAVVCFGPYEINYGGWYRTFTIPSKYK